MCLQFVLVIPLLLTARGTTQSTSTAATTTILPVSTTLPAGSRVAGSSQEIASPNSQSLLCDGFECLENEFCSRANSPVFPPRCRPCSTVQHYCGDMGTITRNYRGCEAFCLSSQREELVTNCTLEKKLLSDDLSSSAAGELATTKTQLKDAEDTIANLKRQIQELGLEKRNLETKTLDLESKRGALETSEKEAKDKTVVLMVVVSFLVAVIVVVALVIICFRWLASKWPEGTRNSSVRSSFQRLFGDNKGFQSAVSITDHQGDPEAPAQSPDNTFLKPSTGNGPVEAHSNPGDSRNLVAPTGDRTERVPGDENDFCQTLQNTNSSDDVSGNTDVDSMTSSARNVNVTNVGSPPVSETAGPDGQWPAFTSSKYASSDEARSEVLQPLLETSHSKAGVKQPVEGKEQHNSKYKFGSNTSLQKE